MPLLTLRHGRQPGHHGRAGAAALAHGHDVVGVAAEERDVLPDPVHGRRDVEVGHVARKLRGRGAHVPCEGGAEIE